MPKEIKMHKKITFTPLYLQVKKDVLDRILTGEWTPGSFLPNEFVLAEQYGVSQGTLRKALNELTTEKHLIRYQGKGTAVAILDEDSSLFPFFLLNDRNHKRVFPTSHAFNISRITADEHLAETLKLEANAEVIHIERIRMLDGKAVINEAIYISAKILPKNIFENLDVPNTLYSFYQEYCGMRVIKATETIEADMPNTHDIKHLDIKKTQPMLVISRTSFGANDLPIEFRISRVNSDNHVYWAELK